MYQSQKQFPPPPPPPPPPTVIYVTTTTGAAPPPIGQEPKTRWQNNATASGSIILMSGGMNLALNVGWSQGSLYGSSNSWFIGVIGGTILSAALRNFIPKKFMLAFSALLILVEGILFTSCPFNYQALLAARYLNGIAIGLAIVPFLTHASEIAVDDNRGSCLALEQYSVSLGIAIQMIYASYWSSSWDFSPNRIHGIFDIVYAVFAGALIMIFIDSPMDHLRRRDDEAALNCLVLLRRPQVVTRETIALLEKQKAYLREEESLSVWETLSRSTVPLVKMLFFRSVMLAFCVSMPLTATFQYALHVDNSTWPIIMTGVFRILGSIVALCLVNKVSRKLASLAAALIIGALLIAIGSIFQSVDNLLSYDGMAAATWLNLCLQAVAGFFAPYTSAYLGEAFPLRVKSYLMDVCVIVEQLIQIILIATIATTLSVSVGLIVQGAIVVIVFVVLCPTMPETTNTSLAEAQRRFRMLLYMKG